MEHNESLQEDSSDRPPDDGSGNRQRSPLVIDTADSLSRLFSILADVESRTVLYILFQHDETTMPLSQLTHAVSASGAANPEQVRERMVHTLLPKLGFVGVIDYDLAGEPRVWLSKNADIVDKELLYDLVERTYRYECA